MARFGRSFPIKAHVGRFNYAAVVSGNRRRRAIFVGIDGMHILKQSTAATDTVGPILDSTGAEYTSAVIGDLSISKNGTEAAMAAAATLTHISNGMYTLVFTTGNTDTLGRVVVRCNKSTYQMPPVRYEVVASAVFDTLVTNGTLASTTSGRTIVTDSSGVANANLINIAGSAVATGTAQLGVNVVNFGGSAGTFASGRPEVKLGDVAHGGTAGVLTLSRIIVSSATTNTPGVTITGNGTGVGMVVTGGASGGDGVQFTGGASGGIGFQCYGPAGTGASFAGVGSLQAGLSIQSQTSNALVINGATGGTGVGILVTGGATAGDAVQFTASGGNSDAIQLTSAGSGHALSAVGTVNVSGAATFASTLTVSGATTLTGAVTASNASNNIVGIDVAKISGDATAADNAESFFDGTGYAGTNNVIPLVTTTTTATNVTTVNGLASGVITATSIAADAIGASELAADAVAEIADAVWDELLSGHAISGSAGAGLSAAGSAGDPWSTALPGAYSAGTAGYIVGTNLDGTVSSRASQTSLNTLDDYVDTEVTAIKTVTDAIGATGTGLTAIPWNASWDAEVQSECTDALQATIPDSIPADGTIPSVQQALYMLVQLLTDSSISGTTWTVKKVNGSTTLFTITLNDGTTPTGITRAS